MRANSASGTSAPSDWGIDSIENLASITTGSKNTQDQVADGEHPFFVRSQNVERINSYSFDGEGILTAGDGVGTGKIFHYINGKCDLHQRVYLISDFSNRLNAYYFYLFFSSNFYNRIMQMTAKSSVDSVRREMIAEMPVLLPSIWEQEDIATALRDTSALIDSLENIIAKKRLIKQGAMQDLLTGERRLPSFNTKWEKDKLCRLGDTFGGLSGKTKQNFGCGSAKYITFMNVMYSVIINSDFFDLVDVQLGETQNAVVKEDLLFNSSSETSEDVGMCSVLLEEVDNVFLNSFCFGFRIKDTSKMSPLYLAYYFRSEEGRKLFRKLAQGAIRYNISKKAFLQLQISLPSFSEQTAIASVLSDMDAEIAGLEGKLAKTRLLKQGMMQDLLTGRVRLA